MLDQMHRRDRQLKQREFAAHPFPVKKYTTEQKLAISTALKAGVSAEVIAADVRLTVQEVKLLMGKMR